MSGLIDSIFDEVEHFFFEYFKRKKATDKYVYELDKTWERFKKDVKRRYKNR